MRISVDKTRCVGHGICESIDDTVFEVTDSGHVEIDDEAAARADDQTLAAAVSGCPSAALRLQAMSS